MAMKERPFRYKAFGEGDPVVVLPGLDGITEFFADVYPALAVRHRVVKYHLPLLGEARAAGRPYDYDFIASDLRAVLDELGIERAHLVGESFGGSVALWFTLAHPDKVAKLVVLSSAPRFELTAKVRLQLRLFPFVPMWLFARVHLHEVCEPGDPRWLKELFVRNASWADHGSVVARARLASRFDVSDRVSRIRADTLVVLGETDRFTGRGSSLLNELLPRSRMVEIPGSGHLCHAIQPERFVEEVERHLAKP